jgi:hypothetical protein
MPILTIRHSTYRYKRPVAFGEHRMICVMTTTTRRCSTPSSKSRQRRATDLTQDIFGNHVATARFAERASELRSSAIRLDHAPADSRRRYRDFAQTHPFAHAADGMPGLTPFIGPDRRIPS